jgi:transcriptional regulator
MQKTESNIAEPFKWTYRSNIDPIEKETLTQLKKKRKIIVCRT